MKYWLLKTEPNDYSWSQMQAEGVTFWDGVRNSQAQNNMKSMSVGDLAFFYHTGKERGIVGIVSIDKEYHKVGDTGAVSVKYVESLKKPVSLKTIKNTDSLKNLRLLIQPRLSVLEVSEKEWNIILSLQQRAENRTNAGEG